jgi:hypothetical protein
MAAFEVESVKFTAKQLAYLEKNFQEIVGSPTTTEAELRWRSGQRSVLFFIKARVASDSGAPNGMV